MVTFGNLKADGIAGLTCAMIALPQAVAFATIAGLPPQYGLYAAMVPTIIAALFGSSWHLVTGPTTALSIVVFASISPYAEPGTEDYIRLVLTLTFLAGFFQLLMGLAKMGKLVNFISHTVVIGFTAGAAVLIATSQIKNFFGLDIERGASVYEVGHELYLQFENINLYVTFVGVISLASGILSRRFIKHVPYMITAMVVGGIAASSLQYFLADIEMGIKTVGALSISLPPITKPDFSFGAIETVFFGAIAITVLGLTEASSISRSLASKSGQFVNGNQEFVGQGMANIFASFFSAYASSGSFNRSGVNYESGAKTPLAAVFAALLLFALIALVAPLAAYLPIPAMSAVLFLVAWNLIDFKGIWPIIRANRKESIILAISFIGTIIDLEKGIFFGILMSLIFYLSKSSRPTIRSLVPDPERKDDLHRELVLYTGTLDECLQLKFIKMEGDLYFGSVDHMRSAMMNVDDRNPRHKHLVLVMDWINMLDLAGIETLAREAKRRRALGGGLYLIDTDQKFTKAIQKSGYLHNIDEANIFTHKSVTIASIYSKMNPEICRHCDARIFRECKHTLPGGEAREEEDVETFEAFHNPKDEKENTPNDKKAA